MFIPLYVCNETLCVQLQELLASHRDHRNKLCLLHLSGSITSLSFYAPLALPVGKYLFIVPDDINPGYATLPMMLHLTKECHFPVWVVYLIDVIALASSVLIHISYR